MAYLQGANNRKMIGKNKRRNTTIIIAVGFNKNEIKLYFERRENRKSLEIMFVDNYFAPDHV